MKAEEVHEFAARKPFRAFTINLVGGEAIEIDSAEAIVMSPRRPELVIAFTNDGRMRLFEHGTISSIQEP